MVYDTIDIKGGSDLNAFVSVEKRKLSLNPNREEKFETSEWP